MSYHKPQSAREWGEELWAMSSVQRTSEEFDHTAHRILVQGRQEGFSDRMNLLDLCRMAPEAVKMDTVDLHAAVRHLVDFAWEATSGADARKDSAS